MASTMNNFNLYETKLYQPNDAVWQSSLSERSSPWSLEIVVDSSWDNFQITSQDKFPNLKSQRVFDKDSSVGSDGACGESIGEDSGYGSTADKKTSRWIKMNENLLHKDVKQFIKKNSTGFKTPNEVCLRKGVRNGITSKKSFNFDDNGSGNDYDCFVQLHEKVVTFRKEKNSVIAKNLLMLCESISSYLVRLDYVERENFNATGSSLNVDIKSVILLGGQTELLHEKVPRLIAIMLHVMNISGADKMIRVMEMGCAKKELPKENFVAEHAELKNCIDWFRKFFSDYMKLSSVENFNNFIQIIRRLSSIICVITTRLWILSSLNNAQ